LSQGNEFSLPSGATLLVSMASFANAKALHDALCRELRGKGMGDVDVIELSKALSSKDPNGLNWVADKIMGIVSSKEIESAFFACAEKALYRHDGQEASSAQVTKRMFDEPTIAEQARSDFYHVFMRVAEVNLRPFIKALSSALKARADQGAESQASSTETGPTK